MNDRRCRNTQAGFTLVEVLISVSIIGVLPALLIPAVQSARQEARRASCASNLHQIGLALQKYHASFEVFPAGISGLNYSVHVQLLPYIDQANLYSSFNFTINAFQMQGTVASIKLATYQCPSDPDAWTRTAVTSYAGCSGDGIVSNGGENGLFGKASNDLRQSQYSTRDIIDGTSQTVAFSEWLIGMGGPGSPEKLRNIYHPNGKAGWSMNMDTYISECRSLQSMDLSSLIKGFPWYQGGMPTTLYNHALSVDDNSCFGSSGATIHLGISASSLHYGGVNIALIDGSARFIPTSIALPVWRALATRANGEVP